MLETTLRGRYKIVRNLGKGGFGETYLAEDRDLPGNPHCVVKRLKPQLTAPLALQVARRLFDTEAQVLYRLGNHDQIPRLLAHFEENQEFYLVQEFIDGNDLSKELTAGRQWSEEQVIAFLQDLLQILEFVHQQNVIHRDIKPANLIKRASDGKIVLIDFGAVKELSTLVANTEGQTIATVAIGTPGYMPSEQNSGNPKFSSDIYAVGTICIQAFTGISALLLPKDADTSEIIWHDLVQVSPQLADILDKMVCYDFRQRYQSASEVLQALTSLTKTTKKRSPNNKIVVALVLVTLVSSIAVLAHPEIRQIFGLPPDNSSSNNTDFLIYENSVDGIEMKYPKNWILQDIKDTFTGEVANFLSPPKSGSNTFQAELNVEIQTLKQPISLAEYTNSKVNEITQFLTNAKIHESHSNTLANYPGHAVVYTGKQEQYSVKRMAVWTLKNNKAYIITYTAEESQYDEFLNTAQAMINSLKIR